jgi:hypothetical protein
LALKSDGTIVGWGRNDYGQATPPCALNFVVAVAAGNGHSLVLKSDRTVVGWGDNFTGQASPPGDLTNVVAVAAGGYLSLALKVDGTVVHWGDNAGGVTTPPAGLSNVVAIATGPGHSLALKSDGRVVGWGDNYGGRVTPPVGLSNVVAVAAGGAHSLALKSDGTVVGWGSDYNEDGYYRGQATPPVGLSNVAAVAAGEYHSLALKGDSTVVGWGRNDYGQATTPGGLTNVAAIAAGGYHSLALVAQFPFPATVTLSDLFQTYDGTAKLVSAATSPSNLAVIVTYDDSLSAPTNVGSYTVVGRINDTNYQGSATNTLVIQKATAIVMLSKLTQFYDGTAKPVSVVTAPPGLAVNVSYNGSVDAPTNIGRYAVVGTVNDLNGEGSATGILAIVAAGLIGWWPGDGNAYDFAGTNNALLRGGATFVTGEVGPGFSLNGTNAFIEVPDSSLLYPGTNSFSLSAWVETTNAMGTR